MRRFFNSCLNKRSSSSDCLPPELKSPHIEGSTETDCSDATLVSLQSPHSPKFTRQGEDAQPPPQSQSQSSSASQHYAMAKAAKGKTAPKSAKDRKPYLRVQQATRSGPQLTSLLPHTYTHSRSQTSTHTLCLAVSHGTHQHTALTILSFHFDAPAHRTNSTPVFCRFYTSRAGENQDGGKGGKEKVDKKNIDELLGALFDSLNPGKCQGFHPGKSPTPSGGCSHFPP